jgi:valyl-tRNA synthetase
MRKQEDIPTTYDQSTEDDIYKLWELSGYFNPDNLAGEPFTIVMPPPNATGTLHIGHAFEVSIQDTIIRYQRMRGKKALWLPGTDHAAIATNTKVEKILTKQEGKNRHDIGREAFVKRVEEFVAESRGTIQKQIRTLGASADWNREAFTFDEPRNLAVRTAFKRMFDDGLIYRGIRVINWDPKGQTAVSDDEVVHKPEKGQLFFFKYSEDFPIEIATTRPETKFGDVAVAVNPKDPRYKEFIDKEYDVDFAGTPLHIKVIGDDSIDPEFGTGAVGVTPAHSMVDYEIAQRHKLPAVQIINEYGKMMDLAKLVAGKKTKEARDITVEWLSHNGLLSKVEFIDQNIATAERSGGVIEPLPKLQWFIDVNKEFKLKHSKIQGIEAGATTTLKALMRKTVENGQIKIMPEREEKKYFHWIDNLRDWNISRQLWYGHRIPVWYKNDEIYCGIDAPEGKGWEQDPDTLDTWFSSALWTFSPLGWPEQTEDLKTFHPTDFMSPGYEILFPWVARMILMSTYHLGEIPFKTVYMHGIVRDAKGQKFSKSLDNGVDPVEVIKQYGADALRMSLLVGVGAGNDSKFDIQKVKGYRNFANKIWNIARFVIQNTDDFDAINADLGLEQEAILKQLDHVIEDVTEMMDKYDLAHAAETLYHYVWHNFADKIIEDSKVGLSKPETRNATQAMLLIMLKTVTKLLHPFMPFVTESIRQLRDSRHMLMVSEWPKTKRMFEKEQKEKRAN